MLSKGESEGNEAVISHWGLGKVASTGFMLNHRTASLANRMVFRELFLHHFR